MKIFTSCFLKRNELLIKSIFMKEVYNVSAYSSEVLEAMEEAKRISRDDSVKGCLTMQELQEALEDE